MKARMIAAVFVSAVAAALGCSKKCKNPMRIEENVGGQMKEGRAIQCHAVEVCRRSGGLPDRRTVLQGGNDPIIVDRGSDFSNRGGCIAKVKAKYESFDEKYCWVEVSPELICLDAAGGPDGSDGRSSTGIFVTVGVAAAGGGDYLLYDGMGGAGGSGGLGGAGDAGGLSAMPGAEGQGEI